MNWREAVRRVAELRGATCMEDPLHQHLNTCAACREIADSIPPVDSAGPNAARLTSIQDALSQEWKPVRPLPSPTAQLALLCCLYALVAVAIPVWIGLSAVHIMHVWQILIYDGAFAAIAVLVASIAVQRLNPGMRAIMGGSRALWFVGGILTAIVLLLFPNYSVQLFATGIRCLETGCVVALLASLLFAFALRRTFASRPVAAGAAVGFLAGLCGATALALHCVVLTAPHILVWHLTVPLIGCGAGAVIGWIAGVGGTRRTAPIDLAP